MFCSRHVSRAFVHDHSEQFVAGWRRGHSRKMSNVGTPTPKMANKETQHPELTIRSSSLLHELTSLPLVGSLGSLYTRTRDSHWVLKRGFGVFEDACSIVLDRLHIGSAMGKYSSWNPW